MPIVHIGVGDAAAKLKDYPTAITAFQRALQRLSTEQQANIAIARLQFIVQPNSLPRIIATSSLMKPIYGSKKPSKVPARMHRRRGMSLWDRSKPSVGT